MLEYTNTLPTRLTLSHLQQMEQDSDARWDQLEEKIPHLTDLVHAAAQCEEVAMQLADPDIPNQSYADMGYDIKVGMLTVAEAPGWEYVAKQLHADPKPFLIGCAQTFQDRMCWIDVEGEINPIALLVQYIQAHGCARGILRHLAIDMAHAREVDEDTDEDTTEYDYHDPLEMTRDIFSVFDELDLPQHYATAVTETIHQEIALQEVITLQPTFH